MIETKRQPLSETISRIERSFHAVSAPLIASLEQIAQTIADAPGCSDASTQLLSLCRMLTDHIFNEQHAIFVLIGDIERSDEYNLFLCEDIARPIGVVTREHAMLTDQARAILELPSIDRPSLAPAQAILSAFCDLFAVSVAAEEGELYPAAIELHHAMKAAQNS